MDTEGWVRFFVGGWGSFFTAYLLAQLFVPLLTRGSHRKLALLPVPVMFLVAVLTARAYSEESNLWPIWLILLSTVALVFLALLGANALLRKPAVPQIDDAL